MCFIEKVKKVVLEIPLVGFNSKQSGVDISKSVSNY